ncbi:MAG: DNA mismatch repair protein MutS [Spirochaetae bacterium HGW-Spirochaetae-1]|jgi:DNA mismatch repair protein MutS|nr:MAG: DNA mismatch repair protein MutS [Spirochaetae bacterium HGW-Spirochaetae-1]
MENSMDSTLTPMMKQYMEIKRKHQNEILFFRMGDFYEMFFDDAHAASKILDIALTSRQNDVPMCGIPFHAAESYIVRLIKAGKRVAICEQMETVPSTGTVVRREVVRIITPGTVIEQNLLHSDENNFLASAIIGEKGIGLAFVDISTGDFFLSSIDKSLGLFRGEIARFNPTEIILREGSDPNDGSFIEFIRGRDIPVYRINEWLYDTDYMRDLICDVYKTAGTKGLGIQSDMEIMTAGSILQYLRETHRKAFGHLKAPQKLLSSDRMVLDDATIGSLELILNQQDGSKNRSLFSVLNHTKTPMGRRVLERSILQPLLSQAEIERKLDIVQYFHEFHDLTVKLQSVLKNIHDVERILSRFILGKTFPRNFIALEHSVTAALEIQAILLEQPVDYFSGLLAGIPDLRDLAAAISAAIADEPALSPEQGRVIREGYSAELDRLYNLKTHAKEWVLQYQEDEKKRLGISTLKIKYNRILGYYIEISKGQTHGVPETYFRKQTLVGAERYTTEELQKFETDIMSASEKIVSLEKEEIEKLRGLILARREDIQKLGETMGLLDFYASLAFAAIENRYVRPAFNGEGITDIKDARHPVVEKYYTREVFIPNDIHLDTGENMIQVITGPNMSGKSTYIRTCAMVQLMAQIGSFVPAREADCSIVDRIFTRIGASDNISRGESTFLVEMNETANILNNATERSLIIMDEVGRGTSTYDGLSIAWAVTEYILRYIRAKTLFATHYHELTQLGSRQGIVNYNVMVREHLSGVDFLHKVAPGSADKSYGIHVAKLAGIPQQIVNRAAKILDKLENASSGRKKFDAGEDSASEQLEIFNAANHLVIQALENIDLNAVTPLDALNELNRLKKLIGR